MPSRQDLVNTADAEVGYLKGQGFDGPNKFSADLGLPGEAWCGDFVTDVFKTTGVPLPSMQVGHPTGFSFCPSALTYGASHGGLQPSWSATAGDIFLFDFKGHGVAGHSEIMVAKIGNTVVTVGGNSGPGGGVNKHQWLCPDGVGNNEVLGTLNADHLVTFGAPPLPGPGPITITDPPPKPSAGAPPWPGRLIVLKSPHMTGNDVRGWQERMAARGWKDSTGAALAADGDYGPLSAEVCGKFQSEQGLMVDQQIGPITWNAAFRTDNLQ